MNRRTLLGRCLTIAAAVGLAPSLAKPAAAGEIVSETSLPTLQSDLWFTDSAIAHGDGPTGWSIEDGVKHYMVDGVHQRACCGDAGHSQETHAHCEGDGCPPDPSFIVTEAAWTALVAACSEQGHELSRVPWDRSPGVETFLHHPYPSETRADGSTWTERVESLTLGIEQDGDRAALLRGWLMGVHALGPAVPRLRPLSDWRTSLYVYEGG